MSRIKTYKKFVKKWRLQLIKQQKQFPAHSLHSKLRYNDKNFKHLEHCNFNNLEIKFKNSSVYKYNRLSCVNSIKSED